MESILDKLPKDIITEIMSYSHPDVTFKFNMVLTQMLYYANGYIERNYINRRINFVKYMLNKCDKMGSVY